MEKIRSKARELLQQNKVNLIIGFTEGKGDRPRPVFVDKLELADSLIFDDRCDYNLTVYIHKPEIKSFGKIAIFATVPALRNILQLAAEKQIKNGDFVLLTVDNKGNLIEFSDFKDIENYVADIPIHYPPIIQESLDRLNSMSREQRWDFWTKQFSTCIKCYACRSACPLCYCTKCTVESNQPQWIPVQSTVQGNLEWHILRAMHLAGRCISCGECTRSCPMGIPLGLLTVHLNNEIDSTFGMKPGFKSESEYALSSFKTDDKENFIR